MLQCEVQGIGLHAVRERRLHHQDPWVAVGRPPSDLSRVVGAVVGDDHQLEVGVVLVQELADESLSDRFLVSSGRENGDERLLTGTLDGCVLRPDERQIRSGGSSDEIHMIGHRDPKHSTISPPVMRARSAARQAG